MFFNLSSTPDPRFPTQHQLTDSICLSTDEGWHTHTMGDARVVIKGYCNTHNQPDLARHVANSNTALHGNYCAFVTRAGVVGIRHDTDRGFPLWIGDGSVTNMEPRGEAIMADCQLTMDSNLDISREYHTPWNRIGTPMSDDAIVDGIHQTLLATFEDFLSHNTLPLKMFLTGGMDTTMVWAYLDHFTKDYELVDYEYIKFTPFWKRNRETLKRFWGYRQTHLWPEDCVLISGGNGDENLLRGPHTMEQMLRAHGTCLKDVLRPGDYHYTYHKAYVDGGLDVGEISTDIDQVRESVLSRNANDHQHWHLDRTIHFTPLKDSRLLSLTMMSSREQLIAQARNAHINQLLIGKLDPDKLGKISPGKNDSALSRL